jgi:hypothetical protein
MNSDKQPTAEIPIDRLGPPGIKGELNVLAIMQSERRADEDRLRDSSERHFKVLAQLGRAAPATGSIRGDFGPNDGSSYVALPGNAVICRVMCAEGAFDIKKNGVGEQSLVEFTCVATTPKQAREKFQNAVLPFLDYLAYLANCPISVAMVRVEDKKNDRIFIEYISPYRTTVINPHIANLFVELAPVYAMYREAKNSQSDFYKFLCYYKILEGLLGPMRAEVFARARTLSKELPRPKDRVPSEDNILPAYRQYAGKSIKVFFDDVLTPRFRNAVAHFMTDDGATLNMSAPQHLDSYSEVIFVVELCVRSVIDSHENLLRGLGGASS